MPAESLNRTVFAAAVTIVGVDCATQPEKTGLALAEYSDDRVRVSQVGVGEKGRSVAYQIAALIEGKERVLLALDAPLGWPTALGKSLAGHRAGAAVGGDMDSLFHRATDEVIRSRLGRLPLEVGADRIARTAHAALVMLDELRRLTGRPIALAWETRDVSGLVAIEVYPRGTLIAHELVGSGYKGKHGGLGRQSILRELASRVDLPQRTSDLEENDDALDAVVCVLAAVDFLSDRAIPPDDIETARKEGWIWVRDRDRTGVG